MIKDNELHKAEELSRCLDSLNDNRHPAAEDEQIKELVDLASLVKQSCRQEELPRVLINEIVDNLVNELQEKKQKKSHYWLYSGLSGIAAAVLIAVFSQSLWLQSADQNIARQVDDKMETQKIAAADQSSYPIAMESADKIIPQQDQSKDNTKTPVITPIEEKSTASVSKVLAEIVKATESPEIDQKHNQVAILEEEPTNGMTMKKNQSMDKTSISSIQEDNSIQEHKTSRVMVLPNQAAQPIQVDTTSGDIKHVYNIGTHDEIIITQGRSDESRVKSKEGSAQDEVQTLTESRATQPPVKKVQDAMNSVTMKMDNHNIKIEGKKTPEELQKIAESLVEKEIEE
ncbi:MAG: hypothetical protein H7X79_00140 [Sporomusaceae bacterium]|nr:hypothetical protein [Sporomusaceae bacterium]